ENAALQARIKELETRLRETEEELEFYFTFYKNNKLKVKQVKMTEPSLEVNEDNGSHCVDPDDSDVESEDGIPRGNQNYTEPWSKTLGRNTVLEFTRDSPMFRKRLWAFQETLKPLKGHTGRLLKRTEDYCQANEQF
ncbi:unnamed protein product, partial [Discosporangium mesarthrocarpum]